MKQQKKLIKSHTEEDNYHDHTIETVTHPHPEVNHPLDSLEDQTPDFQTKVRKGKDVSDAAVLII